MDKHRLPKPAHASDLSTEQKILAAARQEFSERGMDGARMQAIANRAGVNKALLHYYFRSKDKLFEIIIRDLVSAIWRLIHADLEAQPKAPDLRSVIRSLVSSYISVMSQHPEIPLILVRQLLTRDKNVRVIARSIIAEIGDAPSRIFSAFAREAKSGRIKKVDPVQLIMNIMGMVIVTFLSQPIVEIVKQETGFGITYDEKFYKARIDFITDMVFDGIAIKERAS
jgi:TetR/AcrR family transcriptional regulator